MIPGFLKSRTWTTAIIDHCNQNAWEMQDEMGKSYKCIVHTAVDADGQRRKAPSNPHPEQGTETPGWLHAHAVIAACKSPCANSLQQMASHSKISLES